MSKRKIRRNKKKERKKNKMKTTKTRMKRKKRRKKMRKTQMKKTTLLIYISSAEISTKMTQRTKIEASLWIANSNCSHRS